MNHYPFIWGFSIVLVLRFSLRRSWSISIPLSNGAFDIPCAWPPSPIKIFDSDGITERQNVYKHVYTYLKDTFYICMKKLLVIYDSILLVSNEDLFFDQLYGTSGIRNQFQKGLLCKAKYIYIYKTVGLLANHRVKRITSLLIYIYIYNYT